VSYQKQMFEVGDLVQWKGVVDPNFPNNMLGIVVKTRAPTSVSGGVILYRVVTNDWGKEMWFAEHALSKKA